MSLRICSSDPADVRTVCRQSRCSAGQRRAEGELGHADDAVHRRADLVAHVGEELALGAAGFHGLVTRGGQVGVDRAQFGGPLFDGALETFLMAQQIDVAPVDLGEHAVESVNQLADFVCAGAFDAHVVAAVCARPSASPSVRRSSGDETTR